MTIIAAYVSKDGNKMAFASDRLMVFGSMLKTRMSEPKWKNIGDDVWVGCSGFQHYGVIMHSLDGAAVREIARRGEAHLQQYLRGIVEACGMPTPSSIDEMDDGLESDAIIIVPGVGVFTINNGMTVIRAAKGEFIAIGTGTTYAYGAASALRRLAGDNSDIDPKMLVTQACHAACDCDLYCGGPVDVWEMNNTVEVSGYERV